MKSIKRTWMSRMELVKKIESTPNKNWCTQEVEVYFRNGYIRIERIFAHPIWGRSARLVNWYKGSLEEARAYNRMLRWD